MKVPALSGISGPIAVENPIFIADLHLTGKKMKTLLCFFWFLLTRARRYKELFILGDFFEYWIGDDGAKPAEPVAKALRRYAAGGRRRIFLMQGNRDFLLGEDFAAHCGATLLATQAVVATPSGRRILLAHGDEWCTLDTGYQAFRAQVRDPEFQRKGLEMTVAERIEFAKQARAQSKAEKRAKTPEEMDVVESAVAADCNRWGVDLVIHGHTHRPATHLCQGFTRVVIPDWDMQGTGPRRRGWVELDAGGMPEIVITRRWW